MVTVTEVEQWWRAVTGLDSSSAGLAEVTCALRAITCLQGFLDGEKLALARRATELTSLAEQVVATAGRISDRRTRSG